MAVHEFADAARGHVDVRRELPGGDAMGLHEVLEQDLAGVDLVEQFGHRPYTSSVVVHDLDVVGAAVRRPPEADPPLVVDPDAVLPLAVTPQRFEAVAGRDTQGHQCSGGVDLQQLASRDPLDVPEPDDGPAVEQGLGISAGEGADHGRGYSVLRIPSSGTLTGGTDRRMHGP